MAPNGRSNLHDDGYQSDVHQGPGPLGKGMERRSTFLEGVCASVTFDSRGRIETVCVGVEGPKLLLLDPRTLETLAAMPLPPRQPGGGNLFTDFAGGGYFYLDNRDRAVIPTTLRHVYVVRQTGDGGFAIERDYDLSTVVLPGDKIISALPDWSGRLWFASTNGVVGTVDPKTGAVRSRPLGEKIANSFAVEDTGGVYIVSDAALYRLTAGAGGVPTTVWRKPYANSGVQKPGQSSAGSGTTPTLMGAGLVAITDNADPMNVLVYRRGVGRADLPAAGLREGRERHRPVADRHRPLARGREQLRLLRPARDPGRQDDLARARARRPRRRRRLPHGLALGRARAVGGAEAVGPQRARLHVHQGPAAPNADAWYLTALDFASGRTVYKRLGGEGLGFNNNYAPVTLGPDGTAYVGTLGGLVALRDKTPPPGAGPASGGKQAKLRRIRLHVRRLGRKRARVWLMGAGTRQVRRVDFMRGKKRLARDRRRPFVRNVRVGPKRVRLKARIVLRDGRKVVRTKRVRRARDERQRRH